MVSVIDGMFNLRRQLFIVSLITLLLPWAGCQYIRVMEDILRDTTKTSLQQAIVPLAFQLARQPELFRSSFEPQVLYVPPCTAAMNIDGYDSEWPGIKPIPLTSAGGIGKQPPAITTRFKLCSAQSTLFLFIQSNDLTPHYHNPTAGSPLGSDHFRIQSNRGNYLIYTQAPGSAHFLKQLDTHTYSPSTALQGEWIETSTGYNVEVRIPIKLIGTHIQFNQYKQLSGQGMATKLLSSHTEPSQLDYLLLPNSSLDAILTPYSSANKKIMITDRKGWPLHQIKTPASAIEPVDKTPLPAATLDALYQFAFDHLLPPSININWQQPWPSIEYAQPPLQIPPAHQFKSGSQQAVAIWYRIPDRQKTLLLVSHPIMANDELIGYALIQETHEALMTLSHDSIKGLINSGIALMVFSIAFILGFATLLSYRIRKLRNQTESAIAENGDITLFPASKMPDEIGDLSRSYIGLLKRIEHNTQYLRSLSHKLAHELRTPLTIVKTSIEMLKPVEGNHARYLERAQQGLDRLNKILIAMSEATQAEQITQSFETQPVDMNKLLQSLIDSYQSIYQQHRILFIGTSGNTRLMANPDLIAQMLDKLIDNAADFAPPDSVISVNLEESDKHLQLCIHNVGHPIPEHQLPQLFDSLVSHRSQQNTEKAHLGFGLHIVKLIAEAHHARVSVHNTTNPEGVTFKVCFHKTARISDQ